MSSQIIVRFENITKRFPGVLALNNVNIEIKEGSCHALVGENGAGKSTLGKILAGIYKPDNGRMLVDGMQANFSSPFDALKAGIGIVHQELAFCENLSVAENLCLESLPSNGLFLSRKQMEDRSHQLLAAIGMEMDVKRQLGELTISQQQIIQIAAAVGRGAKVIIFDEPTSSLSQHETERLFALIKHLQAQGVTSIYISHRLKEIFTLCDTITVLRDGKAAGTRPASDMDEGSLVEMMIGRRLDEYFPEHLHEDPGRELLKVENLSSKGKFRNISFTIHSGEVIGFAGLVGAGRTEIAEAIFGMNSDISGSIYIDGKERRISSPSDAIRIGLGLVPEDRKRHGLVLSMNCRENLTLPILRRLASYGFVKKRNEINMVSKFFKRIKIRAPGTDTITAALSGGNQQKIVMSKWLAADCRILILDEPTRGVDVGAKAEIHSLIDQLARDGTAILLISSELPEVINLSTRILVLRNGRIVSELTREEANQEIIMRLMAGIGTRES